MNVLSFFRDRRAARATKLYDEARELIDHHVFESALKIGRKLRKLDFSGAFEIEGLAYAGLGRHEDAVRVLREGLALAPQAWPNWLLLGSCLSDLERYDEASLAYDRAEACDGADRSVVELNRGIVASRRNDYEGALRHLANVRAYDSREMQLRTIFYRVDALHHLGRNDEAYDLGMGTLNVWRDANEEEGRSDIALIASCVAMIRLARGDDRAQLLAFAIDWRKRTRDKELLWTIRELRSERSSDAKHFNLVLHAPGVYLSIDAVADSPEEALAFLREIDDANEFAIDEVNTIGAKPEEPKGIYFVSGRIFYKETST